jgi:hypothetical protein
MITNITEKDFPLERKFVMNLQDIQLDQQNYKKKIYLWDMLTK